jgi:molybdopterin-guanine dinucleotide biosynthesis protein A
MTFNVAPDMYDRFMGRYGDALGRALSERAGVRPGMRALDIGAGTGKLTAVLTEILGEENVAAVDPSEPFASALAEQLPAADVRRGTAEDLPFEDGSFDAVFAQLVVNFLTDPEGGVAEMARVAKEEGVVAAAVWDYRGEMTMLRVFWEAASAVDERGAGGGRAALGRSRPSRRRGRRDRRLRILRGLRRSLGALPRRSRARRRLHCLARAGGASSPAGGVPAPARRAGGALRAPGPSVVRSRDEVTGVLLVGGASRRFGSPKALARFQGEVLGERAHRVLEEAFGRVLVVGKAGDDLGLPFDVVDDGSEVRAPIVGLVAALRHAETDVSVVLPTDMPLVSAELLLRLAAEVEGHDVAVPPTGPLPGAYRKSALPVLEARLAAGELALYRALEELSVRVVETEEEELRNVNTPADLG